MKFLLFVFSLFISFYSSAQFYYKDILGTNETSAMMQAYKNNKVSRVVVNSYDADNTRQTDLAMQQQFSPAENKLTTTTQLDNNRPSVLISFLDAAGRVIKTIDSSRFLATTTEYEYNDNGLLTSIVSTSADSANNKSTDQHVWQYANGKIIGMMRIKNAKDTTFVSFKTDSNGNVIEEQETRRGVKASPIYYYYDGDNRLTDVVRYNNRARRLLPQYLLEYSHDGRVVQRITVPENGDNYLIWRYQYNEQGLKTKEAIYNKQKELTGKVEYQYSFTN